MKTSIGILGGGLAGLSLAFFLKSEATILEAKEKVGGLCRSYPINGIVYDVGPHIIFSKNTEIVDFINSLSNNHQIKRSNQIYLNGNLIKYPFENFLAQLQDKKQIDYCLNSFLVNDYSKLPAENMLAFFLKTFGEGITRLYLQPYNQKIWKFDPCMMDTQMVERIPKPPAQDIIDSANGHFKEGYLHQLYFSYPRKGGIESLCAGIVSQIEESTDIMTNNKVVKIKKLKDVWQVNTNGNRSFYFEKIINCMPIHELINCLEDVPEEVLSAAKNLLYNSIYIVVLNFKRDFIGDHFAAMFPQPDIIFHRLSRLNFLGDNYCPKDGSSTIALEITFRDGDPISKMSQDQLISQCLSDLTKLKLAKEEELNFTSVHSEKYAYVINDLNQRKNKEIILNYLHDLGILCNGRFAEFEYLNMDQVIEHSIACSDKFLRAQEINIY